MQNRYYDINISLKPCFKTYEIKHINKKEGIKNNTSKFKFEFHQILMF